MLAETPAVDLVQHLPIEAIGYGVVALLVILGGMFKAGMIKWPDKAPPLQPPRERRQVSHEDFTTVMNEFRARLAVAETDARDAKSTAAAANQSVLSVSALIEQSMQNVTDRFASSLDKLDQLTVRMLGRLDSTEVNVAKALAATHAHQSAQEAFENRLQGIETTLRDK